MKIKRKKKQAELRTAEKTASLPETVPAGRYIAPLLFAAALIAAAGARLYKLNFDLPEVVWADSFKFIDQAAGMAARGDFQPSLLQFPGLYPGALAILYRILDLTGRAGQVLDVVPPQAAMKKDSPTRLVRPLSPRVTVRR